jgi:V8-like Glu-specific endopeptidase
MQIRFSHFLGLSIITQTRIALALTALVWATFSRAQNEAGLTDTEQRQRIQRVVELRNELERRTATSNAPLRAFVATTNGIADDINLATATARFAAADMQMLSVTSDGATFRNAFEQSPLSKATTDLSLGRLTTQSIWVEMKDLQKLTYHYDADNRKDLIAVTDPIILGESESIAALVREADLKDNGDGTSSLNVSTTLQDSSGVCEDEPYSHQPTVAYGSGFLVGNRLLATAGHCVEVPNIPMLPQIRVVFGFRMRSYTSTQSIIPNSNIYQVSRVISRNYSETRADWAILELDRPSNRPVLKIRRDGKILDGAGVYILGHPCGLPIKFSGGAIVTVNTSNEFFKANLDSYGGNSGSPVFGTNNIVEGILVRGHTDFIQYPGQSCRRSSIWPDTGVDGEDCTRSREFIQFVPE